MALSASEIELVLRFEVGPNGAGQDHKYTAKYTSADCEWSLTASRVESFTFNLTLTCERAGSDVRTAELLFYGKRGRNFGIHDVFEKHANFPVVSGATISSNSYITVQQHMQAGARILVHGLGGKIRQKQEQGTVYDFATEGPATDLKFVVQDRTFYANKGVLSFVSPVFCAMFKGEFREKYRDEVPLEGVDPESFRQFLEALHPYGKNPTVDNFSGLMELADRYDVKPLRDSCEAVCRDAADVTFGERLQFAVRYALTDMEDDLIGSAGITELKQLVAEGNLSSLGPECMEKLLTKYVALHPDEST